MTEVIPWTDFEVEGVGRFLTGQTYEVDKQTLSQISRLVEVKTRQEEKKPSKAKETIENG